MKNLILVITSIIILFSAKSNASDLTAEQELEFQRRIELYGLTSPKDPIPLEDKIQYDTSIIDKLQKHIQTEYIPRLENELGTCEKETCLSRTSDYLELQTLNKSVCLPYTQCGFYKCMEKKYQCKKEGVVYFTDLAFPTCSTYKKNIGKKWFTQKGHDWIYTVMVCLQKGLIEECDINGNCKKPSNKESCNHITEFTLNFHPGCYLNSGVGVCKLPFKDKINIWRTVGKFLTNREQQEAFEVVKKCIKLGN